MSALISKTVKIQRAGREFRACCPFHDEKTPSFYVNDEKAFYHCFGCGAHGDAIRWMTDQRGLPFIDAVKELAQAANLEMPAPDPRAAERSERAKSLHDVMAAAAAWFEGQYAGLPGAAARAYVDKRGITDATRKAFAIGYAPDSRIALRRALAQFGDAMLVEAGLLVEVEGKEPYDRFRDRLMIPIRDPRGRAIAFGGRSIGAGEPKYLNSPDTPLFDKGRTLYNLDRAAPAARKVGRMIVVEGYLDVIAMSQAGLEEGVAPLGTALTEDQLERLWRQIEVPILCFDGDIAGRRAAIKAAYRAFPILDAGLSVDFVGLPKGEDPDDVIRQGGPPAMEAHIALRSPLIRVIYENEKSIGDMDKPEDRAGLRTRLDSLATKAKTKILTEEFRRSFNASFFEDFGWKAKHRRAIGSSILKTGPRGNRFLTDLFIRSALYGLTRYPMVIGPKLEHLDRIPIDHPDLQRWRDSLGNAALDFPNLDSDGVVAILATSRLSFPQRTDLQHDLRFGFMQVAPERDAAVAAVEKLGFLIDLMSEERELQAEMARLNAAIIADTGLTSYEALEAGRQLVRERQMALSEASYQLGSGQDLV